MHTLRTLCIRCALSRSGERRRGRSAYAALPAALLLLCCCFAARVCLTLLYCCCAANLLLLYCRVWGSACCCTAAVQGLSFTAALLPLYCRCTAALQPAARTVEESPHALLYCRFTADFVLVKRVTRGLRIWGSACRARVEEFVWRTIPEDADSIPAIDLEPHAHRAQDVGEAFLLLCCCFPAAFLLLYSRC